MCSEAPERSKFSGGERVPWQGLQRKRVARATQRPCKMYRPTCRQKSWRRPSPTMHRYDEQTVVIKFGGHAMGDQALADAFAKDIVYLKQSGSIRSSCTGAGRRLRRCSRSSISRATSCRASWWTDKPTVEVVEMVLAGRINKDIVRHQPPGRQGRRHLGQGREPHDRASRDGARRS